MGQYTVTVIKTDITEFDIWADSKSQAEKEIKEYLDTLEAYGEQHTNPRYTDKRHRKRIEYITEWQKDD